jgi:hypothetical protein
MLRTTPLTVSQPARRLFELREADSVGRQRCRIATPDRRNRFAAGSTGALRIIDRRKLAVEAYSDDVGGALRKFGCPRRRSHETLIQSSRRAMLSALEGGSVE